MNEVVNCKDNRYVLRKKPPKDDGILSEDERFKILEKNRADIEVYKYLKEKLENLKIEVCGDYEGKVLDLMKNRGLEGWCWQTTESSIVFLNNNDYIERGNLVFDQYKKYWHSWINFYYEGIEYTFDPCLDIISKKKLYQETFETEVKGIVSADVVRDELINRILNPKPQRTNYSSNNQMVNDFMKIFF